MYGGSPSKGFVLGQSAGATLGISTALNLNRLQQYRVNGVVALGPVTCAPSAVPSHLAEKFKREENTDSAIIDNAAMDVYLGKAPALSRVLPILPLAYYSLTLVADPISRGL
jgi:acetyl esterase/lipase